MDYDRIFDFIVELDKLKGVYRKSYLSDGSRNENSAEHSWHLTIAVLMLHKEIDDEIDLLKTLKMSLVHDICEIGAGDISVFDEARDDIQPDEKEYLTELCGRFPGTFTDELLTLWEEYEAQQSCESRWVKVFDRLLPFCMNLITKGRSWQEQGVIRDQVLAIHEPIRKQAPEMFKWMEKKSAEAVARGWLKE
ncbi:MAG: HD domain-containing protein [Spirochaetales bacterium]|nr:HD domain-containing protein [Spirochaetales bacterium]